VVPLAGRLVATGDRWEPFRLLDRRGVTGEAARGYFGHLQAAGRSESTIRSYGLDLLRWFRFVWAAGVAWGRAARAEAREFCRWLVVAGKPVRPHWRQRRLGPEVPGVASGQAYAHHHPGIDSLHLSAEVAGAWKQRMRTKPMTITLPDGSKTVIE